MTDAEPVLRLGLPKGRMQVAVLQLLADAGIRVEGAERGYRPSVSASGIEVKLLKPQNLVEMLHRGSRDVGLVGVDWVAELQADVIELLDTGLDPVRLVAAAPADLLEDGRLPGHRLVVASEYQRLTGRWLAKAGIDAQLIRSYGATEAFPPEDADCIVDNTATGATLEENGLVIVDELMSSSTRLYAHPAVMRDSARRPMVEHLVLLLSSVLEARKRILLEVNVPADRLDAVVSILPAMKEPTIAMLSNSGYAVRAAVPREQLPELIAAVRARGGTDVLVSPITQIVP